MVAPLRITKQDAAESASREEDGVIKSLLESLSELLIPTETSPSGNNQCHEISEMGVLWFSQMSPLKFIKLLV